jgi:hypothetical protein
LTGTVRFDTDSGNLLDADGESVFVETVLVDVTRAPRVPVRVLLASRVAIESLTVSGTAALAIVADGLVSVSGRLSVDGDDRLAGPGAVTANDVCLGEEGSTGEVNGHVQYAGHGGGGHRTQGAPGGSITGVAVGGAGGAQSGNPALVPLRGGCSGFGYSGENGGGAIQISSRSRIDVSAGGILNANGGSGAEGSPHMTERIWAISVCSWRTSA